MKKLLLTASIITTLLSCGKSEKEIHQERFNHACDVIDTYNAKITINQNAQFVALKFECTDCVHYYDKLNKPLFDTTSKYIRIMNEEYAKMYPAK